MKGLVFILCIISTDLVADEEHKSIKYSEINSILNLIENETESNYIFLSALVVPTDESINLGNIKLWLSDETDETTNILVEKDGSITLPVLSKEQAKKSKHQST